MKPPVMEVESISAAGGWTRRISIHGAPRCTVESQDLDVGVGMVEALRIFAEGAYGDDDGAPETSATTSLRDDLALVIELYRTM